MPANTGEARAIHRGVFAVNPAPTGPCIISAALQRPLTLARCQLWHFIRLGTVHCLENLQLVTIALDDERCATLVALQPQAVIVATHGRAITCQAQGEAVRPR